MAKSHAVITPDESVLLYKQQLTILRSRLRAEMEQKYQAESAEIQKKIDAIAFSYAENGESMAKVAKRLGTTNWKSAADAVSRARMRLKPVVQVAETRAGDWTVDSVSEYGGHNVYHVTTGKTWTGGSHTATLYVEPESKGLGGMVYPEGPMFLDDDAMTPLHAELRDNWATSPIAAHIKELEAQQR